MSDYGFDVWRFDNTADPGRPHGIILRVTYQLDERCVQTGPTTWEVYGPPDVVFAIGEAGWFAASAPAGHTIALVTEDAPDHPGLLRFRPMPGETG